MGRKTELIAVLDVDTEQEALRVVEAAVGCEWFKVGSQLFTRLGPPFVRRLVGEGKNVFLDLKFHDIPNTVRQAVRGAASLGASLCTLHASGGAAMVAAAREAVEGTGMRLLAVTVLTSLDARALREELGIDEAPEAAVARLARLAVGAGAHGIVCSPREIVAVRDAVGPEPLVVTPGIRPAWAATDDQARVATPAEAARAGADFVVVGRPITKHANPAEAVRLILEELQT